MRAALGFVLIWCAWTRVLAETKSIDSRPEAASGSEPRLLQFVQRAPYSDTTNITRHFGFTVEMPAYEVTNELFRVLVPTAYATNGSWGLLVWISPADDASIPVDFQAELEVHKLLFVGAQKSGNHRHPLDRFRLALDATCNMCRRYPIDRRRIYIGGFSGGARMASMLGVGYADIFTGTLCVCGVNFYADVAGPGGKYYPGTFVPDPGVLLQGKRKGRFVLLTGENDENRENTQRVLTSGFKREGFRHVFYLEVPGMSHTMPPAKTLGKALDYLAGDLDGEGAR
jgi:dienelactone hydrolase